MNTRIFILIDFDNIFKKPLNKYSAQEFELIIKDIIREVLNLNQVPSEIKIRFYGGWFKDEILTSRASVLQQLISTITIFPIIKDDKRTRGSMELATTMYYYPDYIWTNTFKEKKGIARLRINQEILPEWCNQNREQCPAYLLNKFTAKKDKICFHKHCEIKNSEVFVATEQKMVDTMIACDLITFTQEDDIESICLFSDDLDLLPPLGFSSVFKTQKNSSLKIQLFIKNERQIDLVKKILMPFDVKIIQYE